MTAIVRLLTTINIHDGHDSDMQVNVSALHEAVLADGLRIPLLVDRGWSSSGTWSQQTLRDMVETARVVVGPDEPFGEASSEQAAIGHWQCLSSILARHGFRIEAVELRLLSHDVVLTGRLSKRISGF